MALGLKRGVVELVDHDPEWKTLAVRMIERLWNLFGSIAVDIQHVGSTAIKNIKAKPIIDIAIGVKSFNDLDHTFVLLDENGIVKSTVQPISGDILCAFKDRSMSEKYVVHIEVFDSVQWHNQVDFRDYLNVFPQKAKVYGELKIILAKQYPDNKEDYLNGKKVFIEKTIFEAGIYMEMRKSIEITAFEPINKGWSGDKKYFIKTADNRRMLLRVSDIKEHDRKKAEYSMMERVYKLGVLTSQPLGFGLCNNDKSVYSLSSWLDGEDVEKVLPLMPKTEQYILGLKAGETLWKIHSLPAPDNVEPWGDWFYRKVQSRIDFYNADLIKFEKGDIIVRYLQANKHLLNGRPQTFNHGDFHISNMMIMPDGQIGVIDFNSFNKDHGDPLWEFDSIAWGTEPSAYFYTGLIKGYFNGEPPREFFDMFSYYLAYDALASLCDTSIGEQGEPEDGRRHIENILRWLDNMNNSVPTWYLKDFYIQWIDEVPYKLKAPFDFSFLNKYGKVFKIFDDQDSGNICFGVADSNNKYFVKFAGAPTERANVSTEEAIDRMKTTVSIYRDLAHPILTRLIDAEEIGGGFAMVFEWIDAECMGRQYPLSREKFMQISLDKRLHVFDEILKFHIHVAKQGYVAVDFYEGSIMYDFNIGRTILCDIEFYAKMPYNNPIGRMWGSSRFMSPEEFELGAVIDEITNVYTMGATAFAFFCNERDRNLEKWVLSKELFDVAKKAVSDERDKRQQSIEQFIAEWKAAKE